MRFSIVMPSFNQGGYIERSIRSIIEQDYPDIELVIIDGGSTDNTLDIIKKYEKHIAYWVSEKDRGQSHALNKGFAKATGEIFGWMNSDDIYMSGAFKKVADVFNKNNDIKVVYGNWYEIDENDNVIDKTFAASKARVPHFPYEGFDCFTQALFWRRDVYEKCGLYDESLHMLMDADMLFRFVITLGVDSFCKADAFLGAFRRHSLQKSPELSLTERIISDEKSIEKKFDFPAFSTSMGICYRIAHRFDKLLWSLKQGGLRYVLMKINKGYRKRKGLLR